MAPYKRMVYRPGGRVRHPVYPLHALARAIPAHSALPAGRHTDHIQDHPAFHLLCGAAWLAHRSWSHFRQPLHKSYRLHLCGSDTRHTTAGADILHLLRPLALCAGERRHLCGGRHQFLLRRLYGRSIPRGHHGHQQGSDRSRALAGLQPLPDHAPCGAAPGHAHHSAPRWQRMHRHAQGYLACIHHGRAGHNATRAQLCGHHLSVF